MLLYTRSTLHTTRDATDANLREKKILIQSEMKSCRE